MDFKNKEIVVFDVETTGLSPVRGDRIIEIAAIKIKDLRVINRFHSMVNPQRPLSLEAFEVNGIGPDMLLDAPMACQILPDFLSFIGESILVGHNIRFDLGFLYNEMAIFGIDREKKFKFFDTMHLARKLLPQVGRYSLWNVASCLGVKRDQKHRAMEDAQMTFEVFEQLVKIAEQKNMLKELFHEA